MNRCSVSERSVPQDVKKVSDDVKKVSDDVKKVSDDVIFVKMGLRYNRETMSFKTNWSDKCLIGNYNTHVCINAFICKPLVKSSNDTSGKNTYRVDPTNVENQPPKYIITVFNDEGEYMSINIPCDDTVTEDEPEEHFQRLVKSTQDRRNKVQKRLYRTVLKDLTFRIQQYEDNFEKLAENSNPGYDFEMESRWLDGHESHSRMCEPHPITVAQNLLEDERALQLSQHPDIVEIDTLLDIFIAEKHNEDMMLNSFADTITKTTK